MMANSVSSSNQKSLDDLRRSDEFIGRHIGPSDADIGSMLGELGVDSLEQLIKKTVPESIALTRPLALEAPATEADVLARLKRMVANDRPGRR